LHMSQLMPLPLTVSCFSKIQIGFTFLVPAHLGSPEKGPLKGCVCVCERERDRYYNGYSCWWDTEKNCCPVAYVVYKRRLLESAADWCDVNH